MSIEIKVPMLPESVADATVAVWHKQVGDMVERDENLVDIETDKVVLEVPSPISGILKEIKQAQGSTVLPNQVIAVLEQKGASETEKSAPDSQKSPKASTAPEASKKTAPQQELSPSVRRLVAEKDVDVNNVQGSGKDGRLTRRDVEDHLSKGSSASSSVTETISSGNRVEKRVPMTRLRARIGERLLAAQHNAAMLTTFNEINMQAVMQLRNQYKDSFEKTHKVRLGFMSFFAKAVIEALKRFPGVNASIDGNDVVYHGYYDIGVAVSTEKGLVVPVLRNAELMSMAQIEENVGDFAKKARDGKLTIEEMTGGTFTITNGGVFGSLLSTPILNPPQSAILGLHKIEDRAVVENGQIVIRPMMYVAMSYDHRMVDGKESVQFLRTVKEMIEDPSRLLLEV